MGHSCLIKEHDNIFSQIQHWQVKTFSMDIDSDSGNGGNWFGNSAKLSDSMYTVAAPLQCWKK